MKTRKYKQRGGSQDPFDTQDKYRLRIAGFTNDQIKLLNRIKQKYDCPVLDHVDGIVSMIEDDLTDPTAFTMSVKTMYMSDDGQDTDIETDDEDDETQLGGSKIPYTRREKNTLRGVGFTDDQIRYMNNIKKVYGLESLNIDGVLYVLNENNDGMSPTAYTASYNKNRYPTYGDTDDEEDTDDETNQLGGNKKTRRKRISRYSIKRETRRRRKSIKRTRVVRKIYRKTRGLKSTEIASIKMGKFIPGLFKDCNCKKTKKRRVR